MRALVICYIKFFYLCRHCFGLSIPGVGYVQKLLKKDFVLTFKGKKLYYKHGIEGSYDYLLAGYSNEPETHLFFNKIIPQMKVLNFADIGASVGEMVIGVSIYDNVENIYAFEPRLDCVVAIEKSIELNDEKRIKVYPNIVSCSDEEIDVFINPGGTASGIYSMADTRSITKVKSVKLDSSLPKTLKNTMILIDVEGAEPLVLESGIEFIKNNCPLIIFEYNFVSKKHFNLDDIHKIIGNDYEIYRLKGDGTLDSDFFNSWNCVAVHPNSEFYEIIQKLK